MFELAQDKKSTTAVIKVIGVGGCGGNTVNYMMSKNLSDVELICANTDVQALSKSKANCIQLGADLTKGLGAGGKPEVGRDAAKENADQIRQVVEDADMVFITAGMGGGTGSGASPVIAEIAKGRGALTVAVVIKPFEYEQAKRMEIAERSIDELSKHVDSLIIISNEKLCSVFGADTELRATMDKAHDVLYSAVHGISELITGDGLINLDFADIKTVMSEPGRAMISSGSAEGDGRVKEAMAAAIQNPLLEDMDLNNVRGMLVNVSSANVTVGEVNEIGKSFKDLTADNANFKMGVVSDESLDDTIHITVVATGIETDADSALLSEAANTDHTAATLKTMRGSDTLQPLSEAEDGEAQNDLLDIPAFLRKQVD